MLYTPFCLTETSSPAKMQQLFNYLCLLDPHDSPMCVRERPLTSGGGEGRGRKGKERVNSKAPPFLLTFALGCLVGDEAGCMSLLYGVWWHYWCDPSSPPTLTYTVSSSFLTIKLWHQCSAGCEWVHAWGWGGVDVCLWCGLIHHPADVHTFSLLIFLTVISFFFNWLSWSQLN